MSGPLIFISRSRVKAGKAGLYEQHCREATELVESHEPRMIGFNSYASADGADVSTVQIHPDAESLDTHLQIFADKLATRAFEAVDSYEIDVYGAPSVGALDMLQQFAGIRVRVLPAHGCGFLRPQLTDESA